MPHSIPVPDRPVIVVGAGVSGLAAAAALRARGVPTVVLEAASRLGGRAWTSVPPELAAPFDHGASWLHAAHRNPLAILARAAGETLVDSEATRVRRTLRAGVPATPAELAAYDAAEAAFNQAANARLLASPDCALADVAPDLPWAASVLNWEGPIIAAADSRALSLRDWHANLLEDPNLEVGGGLGAFVARAWPGDVRLGVAVTSVTWDGGGVAVQTTVGTLHGAACIVTVSTGVLRAGAIRFHPALPAATQDALDQLPMGLLDKVAFRAAGPDRLGLPDSCGVDQFVPGIDHPAMSFICWPHGADHLIGFAGGSTVAALDRDGESALLGFARDQIRTVFGANALAALRPQAVVTRWASDPLFRGAYAYAVPGGAEARAVLGRPLAGGRLVFAGEATRTDGLAGTVGGACLAGQEAAAAVTACVAG